MIRSSILVLLSLALPVHAEQANPSLPPWFPTAEGMFRIDKPTFRAYDEFPLSADPKLLPGKRNSGGYLLIHGKVWRFNMAAPKPDAWAALIEPLQKQGFNFTKGDVRAARSSASLARGDGDNATYVAFWQCCNSVAIIEPGTNPFHVTLEAPTDLAKKFGTKDNIPFAPPIDGGRIVEAKNDVPRNIMVSPACDGKSEAFGTQNSWRRYEGPAGLSDYAIQQSYEDALRAAGWEQFCEGGSHTLAAHYTKDGHDIWFKLRPGVTEQHVVYEITVADAGSGLRAELAKNCSVPIYGVNFDFDKATLRTDADPALNQVLKVMKEDPKLYVEIGGHTDNVGKPEYNLRLSDERAAAVVQWLLQRDIAKARLTSHGYGDAKPIVPNSSEENRARNRRVELKRADCR